MTVASPCRKLCDYDPGRGWCLGCGRTLAEIGGWVQATEPERQRIVARAEERLRNAPSASP